MKNFLIFSAIIIIGVIAFFETIDLLESLKARSAYSKTPAQMEMSVPLNRKEVNSQSLKFQDNTQTMHDKFRKENEKKQQNKEGYEFNKGYKTIGR